MPGYLSKMDMPLRVGSTETIATGLAFSRFRGGSVLMVEMPLV